MHLTQNTKTYTKIKKGHPRLASVICMFLLKLLNDRKRLKACALNEPPQHSCLASCPDSFQCECGTISACQCVVGDADDGRISETRFQHLLKQSFCLCVQ